MVKFAQKLEDTVQPVFGMGFHSSPMEDAHHDAVLMLSSMEAHNTLTNERNGQLLIEMSLMADRAN